MMCMLAQIGIPVPSIMVKNVGGATGVYTRGDPADGEYALDMQVQPAIPPAPNPNAMLCSAAACLAVKRIRSLCFAVLPAILSHHTALLIRASDGARR